MGSPESSSYPHNNDYVRVNVSSRGMKAELC